MSLLTSAPTNATVAATSSCRALAITGDDLRGLIQRSPEIEEKVVHSLEQRLAPEMLSRLTFWLEQAPTSLSSTEPRPPPARSVAVGPRRAPGLLDSPRRGQRSRAVCSLSLRAGGHAPAEGRARHGRVAPLARIVRPAGTPDLVAPRQPRSAGRVRLPGGRPPPRKAGGDPAAAGDDDRLRAAPRVHPHRPGRQPAGDHRGRVRRDRARGVRRRR